jgi:hypothetical protein
MLCPQIGRYVSERNWTQLRGREQQLDRSAGIRLTLESIGDCRAAWSTDLSERPRRLTRYLIVRRESATQI